MPLTPMALDGTAAGADAAPLPPGLLVELPLEVPLLVVPLLVELPLEVPLLVEDPLPLVDDPPVPLLPEVPPLEVEPLDAESAAAEVVRTPPQPLSMASPTAAAKNGDTLRKEAFIESPRNDVYAIAGFRGTGRHIAPQ